MTARIFLKLIAAVLCVLVVALSTIDFLASRMAEKAYIETLTREMAEKGRMIAIQTGDLSSLTAEQLQTLSQAAGARLTVVRRDGGVLVDSEAEPAAMQNHSDRPEIQSAMNDRVGTSVRESGTVRKKFLYVAVPLHGGALRLAVPLNEINEVVNATRLEMLLYTGVAFLPAILLAGFFARHISQKLGAIIEYAGALATGNFNARLPNAGTDELGILSRQLNEMGEKLRKMFEELQREHLELEKMERIRKDFVINVSHELRTPLASIQGYTETLLDGALHEPEHNVRFLSIIRQNVERLGRLTADLLTLSRIELKTQKFQFASYYVNTLLQDSIDSMLPIAEKNGIELVIEPAPADIEVFCDSEAVHQILSNLLDNAIKYTPEGRSVHVRASVVGRPGEASDYVEIAVQDNGIGIPREDLPRLFERFYRVDKARSRELGGTGLGLAIVKHLVRAQGGEVRVASEPDRGSTFTFSLPVQDLGLVEHGAVQAELTSQ